MKNLVLTALLSSVIICTANAALKEGDIAPAFKTQASLSGKEFSFSLKDALKKGPVVVYFYPSAYTGGCNLQAHTFAINKEKFDAVGVSIIGVSLDSIARLNDFSADPDYCAGKIAVASDADGSIAKQYDLNIRPAVEGRKDTRGIDIGHGFAERTTFIVNTDGKVVNTIGGLSAPENVDKTLEAVQQLAASKKIGK
jgi:peroxiredoxin